MTTPVTTSNGTTNQPDQQQSDKDHNMVQMRKALEQANQARIAAEQRAAEVERVAQERLKATSHSDDEDDDEPYVDKKRLNKRLTTFKQQQDEEIEKKVHQKVNQIIEEDRRSNYLKQNPDFQKVMSSDLVQKFADEHKELAENILQMPEGFERQKLVYTTIKSLGIDKPPQKQQSIQEKMDANRRSPFMPTPGSNGPGFQTNGDFSEGGQKNAYQQMKNLQKRIYGTS